MRKGSSTLNFIIGDHPSPELGTGPSLSLGTGLGSTAITTNSSGGKVAEIRYYPWGTERYTYGTTPTHPSLLHQDRARGCSGQAYHFTEQRLESGIGLYYYWARWSPGKTLGTGDPAAGRLIQADTIIPQQQGIQAWDRYAYVNNNPIKYTDPSGLGMCDERWADPEDCKDADPDGDGIVLTDPFQTSQELVDQVIQDGYDQDDIKRGLDIFNAQKGKSGWWWDLYIDWNDPESVWRFIWL
jgi:RHS repeat-associated protein